MDKKQLLVSAKRAIKNLTNDYVMSVAIGWDSTRHHMTLRYYFSHQPTDDDIDLCSCALAELEAEFGSEIQTSSDECVFEVESLNELDRLSSWVHIMISERPKEEELRRRILNQLNWRGPTDTVALIWCGYLDALIEWGLIDVNVHGRLLSLLPKVGVKELDELLAGEPLSPEREAEIDEYLAQIKEKLPRISKWANQFTARGWTEIEVTEAISKGERFTAINNVNKANGATRYVHPTTGKSIVVDDVTKELLQVGGQGFKW